VIAMTKKRPKTSATRPARPHRPRVPRAARAIAEAIPGEPGRIVQRPDGFHWIALDGRQEFGPFETAELARANMIDAADEFAPEPGEALQEAESEIGIADWIDPETGEPAEGPSPPHLEQE
jgi:hypothetical protein